MSRYISGLFAIVIAVGLAAFTKPESPAKPLTDYYFAFDIANHTPTQTNVQNPAYWLQVSDLTGCDNQNQRACKIQVPESTTNSGTPRTLKSTTMINTAQYLSTGAYYVVPGGSVSNEANSLN
jgi:hypothetical protein